MREIIFKGKRTDNGEWCSGLLVKTVEGHTFIINTAEELGCGICIQIFDSLGNYEVYPETVGQFTGLTDKNGKKIFEGDIIKNEYEEGKYQFFKIVYREKTLCWEVENKYKMSGMLCRVIGNMEVIGNIHDNPELLEG